jgi:hypothetical protein
MKQEHDHGLIALQVFVIQGCFLVCLITHRLRIARLFGRGLGAICETEIFILTEQEDTNDGACTP